ncbi:MAG TPA: DNA mismatch repair endonuclease MutL [Myxococcota bacterium]|nr:DNA mismatch repair endonuclease MutL [Myxococcota bacterium]
MSREPAPPPAAAAGRIRRLPDALVDQIAAGEVVERPASVVKELVENALDAGAGRVRVEVREGGRDFLAVTDDGCGMTRGEALLALERHATSKLASAADLARIATFGFRGEALPAIASVSHLTLRTRAPGEGEGTEVEVDHGRAGAPRAAGLPVGTRVEVAALFGSVPARRKFLKAAATEWTHVADWLSRVALARPDVHLDVAREDRPAWSWPATADPLARIAAVLSEREAEGLVAAALEREGLRLRGFVSRPDAHRRGADGLYLYVNGRPVRDRLLRHALLEAYRDLLPRGRFPTAVLELDVPPEAVDVNVHPAKWEVRFAEPQVIHRAVSAAVRRAIEARGWLVTGAPGAAAAETNERTDGGSAGSGPRSWPLPWREGTPGRAEVRWDETAVRLARAGDGDAPASAGAPPGDWLFARESEPAAAPAAAAPPRFRDLRPLGQLLGSYLLLEDAGGLVLVDQHAAHERVLYEGLRAAWLAGGVERQLLLVPLAVELDAASRAALDAAGPALVRFGFELEPFGPGALLARAVPALLADRDPVALVRGLGDELRSGTLAVGEGAPDGPGSVRLLEAADRLFASLACHAARRAGDVLPAAEQRALLEALDAIPWAPTCPHGRPVAVPFSLAEIERRFGRRG